MLGWSVWEGRLEVGLLKEEDNIFPKPVGEPSGHPSLCWDIEAIPLFISHYTVEFLPKQ